MNVSVFFFPFLSTQGWNSYQGDDTGPGTWVVFAVFVLITDD